MKPSNVVRKVKTRPADSTRSELSRSRTRERREQRDVKRQAREER